MWNFLRRLFGEDDVRETSPISTETPLPPARPPRKRVSAADRTGDLIRAFRPEDVYDADAERKDREQVNRSLALVAEHLGASDAVLWRFEPHYTLVEPLAASRGLPPVLSPAEQGMLDWSVRENLAAGDTGSEQGTRFLVTPVRIGTDPRDPTYAVSLHFREDPLMGRTALRSWLTRYGEEIARLDELISTRATALRSSYIARAMVRTAGELQSSRDPMALEDLLVRDSLVVGRAQWAVFVRWDESKHSGVARRWSPEAPFLDRPHVARQGTLVADACLQRRVRLYSDTRPLVTNQDPVFEDVALQPSTGSLLIVPLQRSAKEPVLAALVVGHPTPNALTESDAKALKELGPVAAGALETAYAMDNETKISRTDPLTGLANRRRFAEEFARFLSETDRYNGWLGLVLVDVDHFKQVNDTYGHEAGDEVLRSIARTLNAHRRGTDIVARVGGEELAMLLPQTDQGGASEVAERCRKAIADMRVRAATGEIHVTASFGVAMYQARSGTGESLYQMADQALYAAKNAGRNRVVMAL